jgi:hypothetical protein
MPNRKKQPADLDADKSHKKKRAAARLGPLPGQGYSGVESTSYNTIITMMLTQFLKD